MRKKLAYSQYVNDLAECEICKTTRPMKFMAAAEGDITICKDREQCERFSKENRNAEAK